MKDAAIQTKADRSHATANSQPAAGPQGASAAPPGYGIDFLDRPRINRAGLPDGLKAGVEALSGFSMDDVLVHYHSDKPAELGALAYTQGTDIYVGPGQERHLPHEAWHVVQQKQGRVRPTMQMKGRVAVNDDTRLEREADVMGERAAFNMPARLPRYSVSPGPGSPAPVLGKNAVVQCWLDERLLVNKTKDHRIGSLAKLALAYNANRKGKTRTVRINELHTLQVAVMKWLDGYAVPDQNVSEVALWVKSLMNEVQREHLELVKKSVEQNDSQPPVANFSELSDNEQRCVKAVWAQLVAGTGNIRITETESYKNDDTNLRDTREHVGFRYEALAQFSRLLETDAGRDIVSQVNADTKGKKLVTIKPGFAEPSQGAQGLELRADPVEHDGNDKLAEVKVDIDAMFKGEFNAKRKRKDYRQRFIELDLSGIADPKLKAAAIYNERRKNPRAEGLKIAGKYYKFGQGTSVDVTITRDIRDAEDHHSSRSVDQNRNEIPTPNFINLGHELGHAAHQLTGTHLGNAETSNRLVPDANHMISRYF